MKNFLFELIKFVLSFFLNKDNEDKRKEEQKKLSEELKDKYDRIDEQKQKENKGDIQDRLHNLFK